MTKPKKTMVVKKTSRPLLVDRLIYIAAVVEPAITLPQVYQIFSTHTAAGVSITAWTGYEVLNLIWLWYGIAHKDKMITLYATLSAITMLAVIIGAILYGGKWI